MTRKRGKLWTKEETNTLKRLYQNNSYKFCAEKIGRSISEVKSKTTNMKLKHAPGYRRMKDRVISKEKQEFILANYATMDYRTIAKKIGVSDSTVIKYRHILNIPRKPPSGYKKGHRPANWNKKSPGISYGRMKQTQFRKGNLPQNTLQDGAITIRFDHPKTRSGRAYKWIRIAKAKWIHYHKFLWEQANGPVPPKHVVIFDDGDTMNCELSNIKMITMAENAKRNYNPAKAQLHTKGLSDNYIAGRFFAPGDKKLRNAVIVGAPELIEMKRQQLLLNRELKNERRNAPQKTA